MAAARATRAPLRNRERAPHLRRQSFDIERSCHQRGGSAMIDVRPFARLGAFRNDWLERAPPLQLRRLPRPGAHGLRRAARVERRRDRAGHRLRPASAPRDGDRHLCPRGRDHPSRQPGQRGPDRGGRRAGDARRHRHRACGIQPGETCRPGCSRSGSCPTSTAWRRAGARGSSRRSAAGWRCWRAAGRRTPRAARCRCMPTRRCGPARWRKGETVRVPLEPGRGGYLVPASGAVTVNGVAVGHVTAPRSPARRS